MAKLQCARLTKFIMPSVTDSPTDIRHYNIPYAQPSNSTPKTEGMGGRPGSRKAASVLHARLRRVLHVRHVVEFDVAQSVADLLDAADVDGLDDVAGFRIDHHRAARALPAHALGGGDQRV